MNGNGLKGLSIFMFSICMYIQIVFFLSKLELFKRFFYILVNVELSNGKKNENIL